MKLRNLKYKLDSILFTVLGYLSAGVRIVFADTNPEKIGDKSSMDPWAALNSVNTVGTDKTKEVKNLTVSLYRIFQRIGIYGCIITTVIFLAMMALRWNDPRAHSENKSKIIGKFVVTFFICATSFILGLILQIVKSAAGYD